jgi:hypothetical protein
MIAKTKTVPRANKPNNDSPVVILSPDEDYRPTTDTAFDIETGPLQKGGDGSLLDPQSARVAAIGYYEPAKARFSIACDPDEAAMLRQFWGVFTSMHAAGRKLFGFNTHGFDLPFLIRRSWHHSVPVPHNIMASGRYWADTLVDLMILWRCGGYKDYISLHNLSQFLAVGAKNGNGEHFHLLWGKDRQAAIDYLTNDVRLVVDCARKMGLIDQPF